MSFTDEWNSKKKDVIKVLCEKELTIRELAKEVGFTWDYKTSAWIVSILDTFGEELLEAGFMLYEDDYKGNDRGGGHTVYGIYRIHKHNKISE